jgi:hypothetical protein
VDDALQQDAARPLMQQDLPPLPTASFKPAPVPVRLRRTDVD